jgi:hypothetical protein
MKMPELPMKLDSAAFEKWEKWGKMIHDDLCHRLIHPRQFFRGFNEMAKANAEHIASFGGGDFFHFVAQGYITQVAMTIRRHSKDDSTISFMRVLEQVRTCAPQFTYDVYLEQHPIDPGYVKWQKPTFARFSDDGVVVSRTKVDADIELLNTLTAKVVELCDREFAHLDKRGYSGTVTFGEVEACIDAFDKLVCKYFKLITRSMTGFSTLEATILSNWKDVFTVPMDLRNSTWRDAAQSED